MCNHHRTFSYRTIRYRGSLYYEITVKPIQSFSQSRWSCIPFLDLTYPNMQIAEKRSQATLKIPKGEWTIHLAHTERGI